MSSGPEFIHLTDRCVLKNLEAPYLYDLESDDLYELCPDAFQFLVRCSRGERPPVREEDEEFIRFCLSENLIAFSDSPVFRDIPAQQSPIPSLRYLELLITDRCNLKCRHCYLGDSLHHDLSLERVKGIMKEFEGIHGLRLLISGGEPLLHPRFWEINDSLKDHAFRSVLLSNGTLISREIARQLNVHEVQISLDGMSDGHDSLRGEGSFEKAIMAIEHLEEAGIRVSIATMIHQGNLAEFSQLASLVQSRQIQEWNVDLPCVQGRWGENLDLGVPVAEAAQFMQYGCGGGWHDSADGYSCGAHLCAILPTGDVSKCSLFREDPVGSIDEGLKTCWQRIPHIPLQDLTCNCPEKEACRGGCRYRAKLDENLFGPDLFQCYARGVLKGGESVEDQEGR